MKKKALSNASSIWKPKKERRKKANEIHWIEYQIRKKGMTLKEVGALSGVTKGHVYHVLLGDARGLSVKADIARLLGQKSWEELMTLAKKEVKEEVNGTETQA